MTNNVISGCGVSLISGTTIYGEIQNVSELNSQLAKIKTTSHNTVGKGNTYRPGRGDPAEVSVEVGFTGAAEQTAIRTMYDAQTISTWTIVAPTSATGISRAWIFSGYISALSTPKWDLEGNATMGFKIQPSGDPVEISTPVVGLSALSVTDQGISSLALSPAFAATTYGYKILTDLADTGVCVTATDATSGEVIYVNNAIATTATPTSPITIPTVAGQVIMIPVVVFKTACVPKVTWVEVTHGYV